MKKHIGLKRKVWYMWYLGCRWRMLWRCWCVCHIEVHVVVKQIPAMELAFSLVFLMTSSRRFVNLNFVIFFFFWCIWVQLFFWVPFCLSSDYSWSIYMWAFYLIIVWICFRKKNKCFIFISKRKQLHDSQKHANSVSAVFLLLCNFYFLFLIQL